MRNVEYQKWEFSVLGLISESYRYSTWLAYRLAISLVRPTYG